MRESTLQRTLSRVRQLCTPYTGHESLPDIYDNVSGLLRPAAHTDRVRAAAIVEEELHELGVLLRRPEVAGIDSAVHEAVRTTIAAIYDRLTEAEVIAVPLDSEPTR